MFTSRSVKKKDYCCVGHNITMDQSKFNIKTTAVIAAICAEKGMFLWKCYDKSVNVEKYQGYLITMLSLFKNKKLALFADNLKVHRNPGIRKYLEQMDVSMIYNAPYYPDGNPIETCFAKVKMHFKALKTQEIVNNHHTNTRQLIEKAF